MMAVTPVSRAASRRIVGLFVSLVASLGVSAIGGRITAASVGDWYQALIKPPFNPPDWAFPPVWTALYILMGLAAWRIWDRNPIGIRRALAVYAAQLSLNLGWTILFFGLQRPNWALIEIVPLLGFILWTVALFRPLDRVAAWLLAPYALWVAFAVYLNAGIVALN